MAAEEDQVQLQLQLQLPPPPAPGTGTAPPLRGGLLRPQAHRPWTQDVVNTRPRQERSSVTTQAGEFRAKLGTRGPLRGAEAVMPRVKSFPTLALSAGVEVRPRFFNARGKSRNPARACLDRLKNLQQQQLERFHAAAKSHNWRDIHHGHFDWFLFPIEDGSKPQFNVLKDDVRELHGDKE
eukprot:CAMPEP_0118984236 /NCGR_PEP_ID=MMETSP1173-20130426/37408_1 /TAXON_ID=1034831 /ORGANISM="Rhizochromulina marina cf, Strain CCMP1243" /LENGTH=180 /DNA_ID=CAMNT_0006934887 /DNA_START=56 /DNA_END=595 /DNA_ORIENTATION=+